MVIVSAVKSGMFAFFEQLNCLNHKFTNSRRVLEALNTLFVENVMYVV